MKTHAKGVARLQRQRLAYVTMARLLLSRRAGLSTNPPVVSAGEVAYHVHGVSTARLVDLADEAEQALVDAGFRRSSYFCGRFSDITLWSEPL